MRDTISTMVWAKTEVAKLFRELAIVAGPLPPRGYAMLTVDPAGTASTFRSDIVSPSFDPERFNEMATTIRASRAFALFESNTQNRKILPQLQDSSFLAPAGQDIDRNVIRSNMLVHELEMMFVRYVSEARSTAFDEDLFARFWDHYGAELVFGTVFTSRKVAVLNIGTDEAAYRITDTCIIRNASMGEEEYWGQADHVAPRPWSPDNKLGVLEFLLLRPKDASADATWSNEEVDFSLALALMERSTLSEWLTDDATFTYTGGSASIRSRPPKRATYGQWVVADAEMARRLGTLMIASRSVRSGDDKRARRINLSMNRYVQALQRSSIEDALIDNWIGLESLFGTHDELSFRVPFRIAAYIEPDRTKRVDLFRTLKRAYSGRSRIVHGDLGEVNAELIDATSNSICRAITRICDEPASYPTNLDDLEADLLRR